jgi:RHS repeat-associated protein
MFFLASRNSGALERGTSPEAYEYDPYGRHRVIDPGTDTTYFTSDDTYDEMHAGSINNSIRYTGQRFDAESNLMYYKNRYYDPAAGRFIGRDPLGWSEGPNRYGYVGGMPTRAVDPLGLFFWGSSADDETTHYTVSLLGFDYSWRSGPTTLSAPLTSGGPRTPGGGNSPTSSGSEGEDAGGVGDSSQRGTPSPTGGEKVPPHLRNLPRFSAELRRDKTCLDEACKGAATPGNRLRSFCDALINCQTRGGMTEDIGDGIKVAFRAIRRRVSERIEAVGAASSVGDYAGSLTECMRGLVEAGFTDDNIRYACSIWECGDVK